MQPRSSGGPGASRRSTGRPARRGGSSPDDSSSPPGGSTPYTAVTRFAGTRGGTCGCTTPVTDADMGIDSTDDDDDGWLFCWRCGRAVVPLD